MEMAQVAALVALVGVPVAAGEMFQAPVRDLEAAMRVLVGIMGVVVHLEHKAVMGIMLAGILLALGKFTAIRFYFLFSVGQVVVAKSVTVVVAVVVQF